MAVDVLDFRVEGVPLEHGQILTERGGRVMTVPCISGGQARLQIFVNGEDLRAIVKQAETPAATAEGQPGLAGSYHFLSGYEFPRGLFYGEPQGVSEDDLRYGERVAMMGCNCGDIGCWPFLVRVGVTSREVVWDDFCQPFRKWSYDTIGSFRFARQQYDEAVDRASDVFAETAQYTDEMVSQFAARTREQFAINEQIHRGLLTALARRGEIPARTNDERRALLRDRALMQVAASELAETLGLTERQAIAVLARDLDAVSESAVRAQLAEERRLADLSDAELRAAYYTEYVRDVRRGRFQ